MDKDLPSGQKKHPFSSRGLSSLSSGYQRQPPPSLIRPAEADRCLILELPEHVLMDILDEVVLHEGDTAIFKLALVCSMFRDLVSTEYFRRRAHFKWLHSVCTWSRFSEQYREQYFNMYSVEISTNTAPEDTLAEEEEEN
ncbi:uncharacterized protein [Nothobranchius furzeri]|uniref:uncharacterized protein isoform X6 n=1 Tax=Nothobranchius furzeri TaxID=105023 RepID=UPI003904823B